MNVDRPYERLEALPRGCWLGAVTNSVGAPARRLADLARWQLALAGGALPAADADFGDAAALAPLRAAVADLALPALTRRAPALAEQVLRTLLWHLDRLIDRLPLQSRADAIEHMAMAFRAEWQRDRADWERLMALLPDLGDAAQLTRDQRQGLLHSRGWAEAERLAGLLRSRPDLAALIRRIGRHEIDAAAASTPAALDGRRARVGLRAVRTHLPGAPGALQGLALGAQIERMTPAEAQQLRHPVLRKLWHARWAEARLLHYDSSAEVIDWRPDPGHPPQGDAAPQPAPRARGPMLVALDTSGSMRGTPEAIAKAVVLEAMRVAHAEQRGLRLIAFGAQGEVIVRDLGRGGIAALLELVGLSFDGGTDVQAPIECAVRALHEAAWPHADLLILSDGEFGCTPDTLDLIDEARANFGLRVQGILLGDRETIGLMQVTDEIFWVRDWRDASPARSGFSPVHSKSLTAQFFPNALDDRARRHVVR
ncbi:MAG TPA: VWA domain-containing protein [Burkholderiaceae bacterium]|nr:VWA domain-containing protein [Burkholderiaceae bacterium]